MSEVLDKIDYNLTRIEDRLLSEFLKIQKNENPTGFSEITDSLKAQIKDALAKLRYKLDHSGTGRLELTTDYHEVLRARMYILDQLVDRRIPISCLVAMRQNASDGRAGSSRGSAPSGQKDLAATITKRVLVDREAQNRSFLSFFKRHFGGQKSGEHNIRVDSVEPGQKEIYAEDGIYAAAQQLAGLAISIIDYQERIGAAEDPESASRPFQQARGKATFDSRDLSASQQIKLRDIARSPEEIRRKLEARRRAAEGAGRATFSSLDLDPVAKEPDTAEPEPEERERDKRSEPPRERAVFVARDPSSSSTDRNR